MGGGVSSLPAKVSLAEAKELAGAEWQPAWEEKFEAADAKISKDEALRCWTEAKANADGPASKGAGPPDERKDPGARRKKKDSATAKARWKKGAAKVRLTGSLHAKARARGKTSNVTTEGTTAEGLIRRKPLAKALWKKGVAKIGWIAQAKARAAAIERAQRAGISEQLYEKLHGVDRSGVAEALDFSAIIAEKRGQHLPGTREWVFEAVMRWRTDPEAAKLFWLVGGGGTGKSVAAAELLARLLDKENVAAWHFCKHTEPARSAPAALLRSLAGMLCATVEGFEDALREGGGSDNVTDKVDELFQALIAEPLQNVEPPRGADDALVLIVDALDELPRDALQPVLSLLAKELKTLPLWIKLVVNALTAFTDPATGEPRLVSGSHDDVRVWNPAASGAAIDAEPEGHSKIVLTLVTYVDPATGALRVATTAAGDDEYQSDGTVRVWDAETGDVLLVIDVGSEVKALVAFGDPATGAPRLACMPPA